MMRRTCLHRGDIGDILASIPTLRALGGCNLVIAPICGPMQGRESMKGARFNALRPLLESSPFVESVTLNEAPDKPDFDFTNFRSLTALPRESILHWQARYIGVENVSTDPWLKVSSSLETKGRILFARSPRYHMNHFPWFALVKRFPDALFVGLPDEHKAFQSMFSPRHAIEYRWTENLMELAKLIAGAKMLICNQSSPGWIAHGLGSRLIQETWPDCPNSIIERRNARYTENRPYELEELIG